MSPLSCGGLIARVRQGFYLVPPRLPLGGAWTVQVRSLRVDWAGFSVRRRGRIYTGGSETEATADVHGRLIATVSSENPYTLQYDNEIDFNTRVEQQVR